MSSASDEDISCTPDSMKMEAEAAINNILPESSKERYLKTYDEFMKWRKEKQTKQCKGCYRPPGRRLALFEPQGHFQCYAESYVKCFWGLCDLHKSNDDFLTSANDATVITEQPKRQALPLGRAVKEALLTTGR